MWSNVTEELTYGGPNRTKITVSRPFLTFPQDSLGNRRKRKEITGNRRKRQEIAGTA
jgi:hypothetical protein